MIATSFYKFIGKYKILHIVFWVYMYIDLFILLNQHRPGAHLVYHVYVGAFFVTGMKAISVYTAVYYFLPKVYFTHKYVKFFILVIVTMILSSFLGTFIPKIIYYLIDGAKPTLANLKISTYVGVYESFTLTFGAIAVKFIQLRIRSEKQSIQLQKDKLQAELNYLKSQVNPHFLFNTINSIYVLIDDDKQLARDYLHKFSNMLRYQLYECVSDKISVEKEIEFISGYIELERLRKNSDLTINFIHHKQKGEFMIAPFIFLPLIENAFKYVSSNSENKNYISIVLGIDKNILTLEIRNSIDMNMFRSSINVSGGIGLENVKRRLSLIYPEKHLIEINGSENEYSVLVSIDNS